MGRPPRISREELLDTARRVFAAKGFEAATLADIARELHVTPAAVLRHARSKLELFRSAMHGRITAPPEFILDLVNVDARTDPRIVLRGIAERFVPFVEKVIAENIAIYMHNRARSIVMPFDPGAADSPPRRGIVIVSDYFRRAMDAGVIRHGDPRAAALSSMRCTPPQRRSPSAAPRWRTWRESLRLLSELSQQVDVVYPSHSQIPMPAEMIPEIAAAYEEVWAGKRKPTRKEYWDVGFPPRVSVDADRFFNLFMTVLREYS